MYQQEGHREVGNMDGKEDRERVEQIRGQEKKAGAKGVMVILPCSGGAGTVFSASLPSCDSVIVS